MNVLEQVKEALEWGLIAQPHADTIDKIREALTALEACEVKTEMYDEPINWITCDACGACGIQLWTCSCDIDEGEEITSRPATILLLPQETNT